MRAVRQEAAAHRVRPPSGPHYRRAASLRPSGDRRHACPPDGATSARQGRRPQRSRPKDRCPRTRKRRPEMKSWEVLVGAEDAEIDQARGTEPGPARPKSGLCDGRRGQTRSSGIGHARAGAQVRASGCELEDHDPRYEPQRSPELRPPRCRPPGPTTRSAEHRPVPAEERHRPARARRRRGGEGTAEDGHEDRRRGRRTAGERPATTVTRSSGPCRDSRAGRGGSLIAYARPAWPSIPSAFSFARSRAHRPSRRHAPNAAALADGFGRGATTSRSRTISTTVVGGSITPTPQSVMTGSEPPSRAIAVAVLGHLVRGRGSLERQQPAADGGQRQAPSGEPVQRCYRPGGDDIGGDGGSAGEVFRPAPDDRDGRVEAERCHRLGQKGGTSCQRLDQRDAEIRSSHCEHDTGQTGTRAHVNHRSADRDHLGHNGAVDQVPFPDARRLARADQTADDAVGDQQFGVGLGQRQAAPEHRPRSLEEVGRRSGARRSRRGQTRMRS